MHSTPKRILIVGAGPTGLTLAAELARRQMSCRIIDKSIKPVTTSNALAIHARTLEIFADMGIVDKFLDEGIQIKTINIHDNSHQLTTIKLNQIHSKYQFVFMLPQRRTESILLAHLAELGIQVEMQKELIDLKQNENTTTVIFADQNGQREETEFDWVMACDGGKSIVREKLRIPFYGHDLPEHFVMLDANITSSNNVNLVLSQNGVIGTIPYSKTHSRLIADVTHDPLLKNAKSPTTADFERLIAQRYAQPIKFKDATWTSAFWIHERIIKQYQYQNIFFLGDAAHTHSPIGGQGMNIGIQDAYNLAWKFALTITHKTTTNILTTYESERRPVAQAVLKYSTFGTHLISLQNAYLIKIRNFIIKLLTRSKKFIGEIQTAISETAIHYGHSIIVYEGLPYKQGLKAGKQFIDVEWKGQWLFDYVKGIQHTILFFLPNNLDTSMIETIKNIHNFLLEKKLLDQFKIVVIHCIPLPEKLTSFTHKIFDAEQRIHQAYNISFPAIYVVRPDKYIGFRSILAEKELIKFISPLFS